MNTTDIIRVGIIVGSTRQGRFGDKPAQWLMKKTSGIAGLQAELLDLLEYPLPFFDEPVSPAMIEEPYDRPEVRRWTTKVAEQDAYVICTPEYNYGYPAVLKNALDYVWKEWNDKPVSFVSWGSVSGARSVEQLRQVAVELRLLPIRSAVHIASPWGLLDEQGALKSGALDQYNKAADGMLEHLLSTARLLKAGRTQ